MDAGTDGGPDAPPRGRRGATPGPADGGPIPRGGGAETR